nr:hypothetical protein CPGR_01138 [Mycolicibacter nonchromogenicus]
MSKPKSSRMPAIEMLLRPSRSMSMSREMLLNPRLFRVAWMLMSSKPRLSIRLYRPTLPMPHDSNSCSRVVSVRPMPSMAPSSSSVKVGSKPQAVRNSPTVTLP